VDQFMVKDARRTAPRPGLFAFGLTVAMVGSLAGPVAPAREPAVASLPGIEVVAIPSFLSSTDKMATVECPEGKKVIDAGGSIVAGSGHVAIDDVVPDADLNFVNVTGLETGPYGTDWRVIAYATCADPLPGLEWIKAQTASNSITPKRLTVACSPGKTVLGNGYAITGGDGQAFVHEAIPNGRPGVAATQVDLTGVEGDSYGGAWDLAGFLICADPLPGQQVLSASTDASPGVKTIAVPCPEQVATGSAAKLHNATGTVLLEHDYATDTKAVAHGQENEQTAGDWSVIVYAFCAGA
jgi:hypothetical protein